MPCSSLLVYNYAFKAPSTIYTACMDNSNVGYSVGLSEAARRHFEGASRCNLLLIVYKTCCVHIIFMQSAVTD